MGCGVCPPEASIRKFLLGLLPDEEIARHSAHLGECPTCLAAARHLSADDWLLQCLSFSGTQLVLAAQPEDEEFMRRLRGRGRTVQLAGDTVVDHPHALPEIPGYEILQEIGRGGMGVVYRARQQWPQRTVALKMVRMDSKPARLARFRAEIAAAARFIHPNVISIYEVGEQAGAPYFSMEFASAGSLAQQLATGPLAPRTAADLVRILARAVQFGHSCGVVHRDLKPSNILLQIVEGQPPNESGGEAAPLPAGDGGWNQGAPKIADFGLAKCLDEIGQTQTGELLGTPAYMAPELTQTSSSSDLPSADIYSLGAILYECLTGRPPFGGTAPFQILELARTQDPLSPRRLRQGISRDLETICLKCLAKQPGRRYLTAGALADDLQRYLEGRPILARPVGYSERVVKWTRRHPALATLAAALVALLTGSFLYEQRLHTALILAEDNAQRASLQKERADTNYNEARKALSRILQEAKEHSVSGTPKLLDLRRRQSEHAVAFYHDLANQSGDSVEARFDRAWAQRDAALLENDLGRHGEALQNLNSARATFTALAAEFPNEARYQHGQASALLALSGLDQANKEACLRQALELYETLIAAEPARQEYLTGLASTCHQLGIILTYKPEPDAAIRFYDRAIALRQTQLRNHPEDSLSRLALAQDRINLSHLCSSQAQKDRGRRLHDEAEAELGKLLTESPHDLEVELAWAALRVNWAYVLREANRMDDAIAELGKNEVSLVALLKQEPNSEILQQRLFQTFGLRSQLELEKHSFAAAIADQRKAIEFAPSEQFRRERKFFLALTLAEGDELQAALNEVSQLVKSMPAAGAPQEQWIHLANVCGIVANKASVEKKMKEDVRKSILTRAIDLGIECLRGARGKTPVQNWRANLVELSFIPTFRLMVKDPRWKDLSR